MGCDDFYMS